MRGIRISGRLTPGTCPYLIYTVGFTIPEYSTKTITSVIEERSGSQVDEHGEKYELLSSGRVIVEAKYERVHETLLVEFVTLAEPPSHIIQSKFPLWTL